MRSVVDPKIAERYAADKHRAQRYGNQPFEFHLRVASRELEDRILPLAAMRFYDRDIIRCAVWLHDVVEDTDTTIFELSNVFDPRVVELVDAVSDGPGENRAERKKPMYEKVRGLGLPAVAVKLADRLANSLACGLSKERSRMLDMYQKEQEHFEAQLRPVGGPGLDAVWDALHSYLGMV